MYPKRGSGKITNFFQSKRKKAYKYKPPFLTRWKKQYKKTNRSFFKPSVKRITTFKKSRSFTKSRLISEKLNTLPISLSLTADIWNRIPVTDFLSENVMKLAVSKYEEFTISSVTFKLVSTNVNLTTGHASSEFRKPSEHALNDIKKNLPRPYQLNYVSSVIGSNLRTENIKRKLNCTAIRTANRMSTWVKTSEYLNTNASNAADILIPEDIWYKTDRCVRANDGMLTCVISYKLLLKNPINSTDRARSRNFEHLIDSIAIPINNADFITSNEALNVRNEQWFNGPNTITDTEREELLNFIQNERSRTVLSQIRDSLGEVRTRVIDNLVTTGITQLSAYALRQAYDIIRGNPQLQPFLGLNN